MRALLTAFSTLVFAAACAPDPAPPAAPDPDVAERVRRLSSIFDYIAADYPGCVDGGEITVQAEYDEQLAFLDDASELAGELPPPAPEKARSEGPAEGGIDLEGRIASLRASVKELAPSGQVSGAASGLSDDLLTAYGVVLAPAGPPSFERGEELYARTCVECHGAEGRGDGRRAPELEPPPRSFHDGAIMRDMSPVRAYNTLTDGIADTAMASFELLPPSDRWSLAFYALTLRHTADAAERGEAVVRRAGGAIATTPTQLANATDGEILASLDAAGVPETDRMDALAHVRLEAPYEVSGAPLARARELLGAAVAAYRDGDENRARSRAASAYLDGFEPEEASLRGRDEALLRRIEGRFLDLRRAIADGAPVGEVEQKALVLGTQLDSAEAVLEDGSNPAAFAASFAILLREGLEGALLVLLMLGIARRAGAGATADARAVHAGWIAAVAVGGLTWFASGTVIEALGGARRELIEGVVALVAAGVLLAVSHFVLARLDARRRVAALKGKLEAVASTPRRRLVLASLGFVAVYREAFETVLFLRAVLLGAGVSGAAVAGGAAAGVAVLVALVYAMARLGKRLEPGPLLSALGGLLCALAVVLAGKGVRALQEAGAVGITPVAGVRSDWIGLYPTAETLAAQGIVLVAFAALAAWAALRSRAAVAQE